MAASRLLPLNSKIVPGLLVAVAGLLLTLHNLNIVRIQGILRYWPLILIGFGIAQVVDSDRRKQIGGIVLMVIGTFLQLTILDLINVRIRDLWRFWPLALIAIGIGQLTAPARPRNLTGGLVLLLLGLYFQLWTLNIIRIDPWQLWPVALIVIGIGMVQKAMQGRGATR